MNSDYPILNVPAKYRNLANYQSGAYSSDFLKFAVALSDVWVLDGLSGGGGSGGTVSVSNFPATQPISASTLPLPSGAATELTLQQVRDAIKAQIDIASTLWTDNSGTFYVRRDLVNEGTGVVTVVFTLPDGTTATPGAGLRPLSTIDKDVLCDYYDVITSGTGYSVGDLLARVAIIDANGTTPASTFVWMNLTAGTILGTNPTTGHIERANETVSSRQSGTWTVAVNNFPTTQTITGTVTANTGLNQPLTDAQLRANPIPVSGTISTGLNQPLTNTELRASALPVSVSNFPATQTITGNVEVTSLPALPTGTNSIGSITNTGFNVTGTLPAFATTPTVNIGTLPSISTSNRTVSGSLTTGSNPLTISTGDLAGVGISVTGTWVGTLTFQGTVDGNNWVNVYGYTLPDSNFSFTTTANGQFSVNAAGFTQIRVSPAVTSGTAVIGMLATKDSPVVTSQIRNTSLQLVNNDNNPLSIKLGTGVLFDTALRAGTADIGNVFINSPLPPESIRYDALGFTLPTNHTINTWYDSDYAMELTALKGFKSIEFYPQVNTAAVNAGCIMVIRFYVASMGNNFANSFAVRYDFDTIKGTPDAEGNSIQTQAIRNYAFNISTAGHLKTNTMICELRNGTYLRLQAKVLTLAGNAANVRFHCYFKY